MQTLTYATAAGSVTLTQTATPEMFHLIGTNQAIAEFVAGIPCFTRLEDYIATEDGCEFPLRFVREFCPNFLEQIAFAAAAAKGREESREKLARFLAISA